MKVIDEKEKKIIKRGIRRKEIIQEEGKDS